MKRLVLCLALAGCASGPPIDGKSAFAPTGPVALEWLRDVVKVDEAGYRELDGQGKLPPNVRGDSNYWDDKFFVEGARPLAQRELMLWVHESTDTSPDIVRYRYHVGKLELTVLETTNVTLIYVRGIRLGKTPEAERPALIAETAAQILKMKGMSHDWQFGPPERLGQEGNFTTNADVDPANMTTWEARADGGVMHGVLYFFLYKRSPSRIGFANQQAWFDAEFRKKMGGLSKWLKGDDNSRGDDE